MDPNEPSIWNENRSHGEKSQIQNRGWCDLVIPSGTTANIGANDSWLCSTGSSSLVMLADLCNANGTKIHHFLPSKASI
jgi:hypothetical protein